MVILIRIVLAIFTPTSDADAEALHRFAPSYVTVNAAREHVWAARVAAAAYSVDADMTIAIAYHESRFTTNVVSKEAGQRVSCGVMTPYPTKTCTPKSLLAQYLDGTRHWALDWRRAGDVRSDREALLGYAGGYLMIRRCRQGPVLRHKTHGDDLCKTPEAFGWIRAQIIAARQVRPARPQIKGKPTSASRGTKRTTAKSSSSESNEHDPDPRSSSKPEAPQAPRSHVVAEGGRRVRPARWSCAPCSAEGRDERQGHRLVAPRRR